ncbi:uncharacterized protein BDR25DRAFT_275468 [Lindgomyces ingoldianus]|uniref:Uncharacterized protein n=1 Tax=Lindgomyces ingoldianus TaxID=673940 RepID=A0ACB6RHD6_9PLEO|nr:uncharacterized protein BDR25DRAFT_275468 [Lindgomyces ingoldianus]KAF2477927.1 hypothetical protein BDR25DRAFT_275468 [Lindgomyces ingoldianus]
MNMYKPIVAASPPADLPAPSSSLQQPHTHRRTSSRSNSISSSSVVTVKRSASLKDTIPDPSKPHKKPTPPPSRRRSSVAHVAVDGIQGIREGIGNLNRWSQSTTSSNKSAKDKGHQTQSSFSRRLSISNNSSLTSIHGAQVHPSSPSRLNSSPSRKTTAQSSSRSPASSPHRRARPRSPAYAPPSSVTTLPEIPSIPPLLPATVYDPSSPNTTPSNESPSTAGLFTPSTYATTTTTTTSTDYFNSRPPAPTSNSQRPPSHNKADRILGRSPLGSPPLAVLESEARYKSSAPSRASTAGAKESLQKPVQTTQRERSGSRDLDSRYRSESNASSRLDDSYQGTPPRTRERREKDKKTMLSRALQKANTAVLLDNAQNFEGAMDAYEDACKLLQQVMIRSSGEEDRRKLDGIRVTYTNRIEELRRLAPGYQSASGKSLPARPMSNESVDEAQSILLGAADDEPVVIETATMTRIVNDRSVHPDPEPPPQSLPLRIGQSSGMRESVISTAIRDVQKGIPRSSQFLLQAPPGRLGNAIPSLGTPGLESPMDRSYMPPPLSPRRPLSPLPSSRKESEPSAQNKLLPPIEEPLQSNHKRGNSTESISWLDTIDESGGSSCSSSVHSLSPRGLRRKHLRNASGATEAEFDAALDAAVEAAYDEGFEPYEDEEMPTSAEIIATRLRNVELAKERVREAEREEAIAAAKYRYKESQLQNKALPHVRESAEFNFHDEAEEEERLLDEMTREYMLDGFDFDLQTKSSLPRQSDSSGFSGSTYNSSVSSHRTTGGTSLSTVAEVIHQTRQKAPTHSPPPVPASSNALQSVSESAATLPIDPSETTPTPATVVKESSTVRSRRLSGQNAKNLKIETSLPPVPPAPHTEKPLVSIGKDPLPDTIPLPKTAGAVTLNSSQASIDPTFKIPALPQVQQPTGLTAPSPQPPIPSPADTTFTVSPATPALSHAMSNDSTLVPGSPKNGKTSAMGIRKNKSSLSLKQRTLSISSPDGSDGSIGTPLSTSFSFTGRKQSNPTAPVPTPSVPTFNVDGLPTGGMHLFESDIHSPYSPGSPSAAIANAPIPLEPCPDSYLLRPFWLMRCFYQTIAHPRGGYLSTKLFVPRDVWRVKGVKLKNVDDKIANCDLLSAALQRLATVDTLDADAVLEEMQALEVVLDQAQTQLAKKLGNEVGVHGVSLLFKDAHTVGNGSTNGESSEKGSHGSQDHAPKSAVSQSKSYLTSWRKLRSKNSAVGLSSMTGAKGAGNEVPKDSLTMATLPMTSLPNIRFAKRDVSSVLFEGPNSGYMASLARLFDSAQILDQIARQVEDPGLKHSSPTHVGLELSARHAAEFFGFYICRFVLTDVTLMLDKFIKRGSEWVLV